MTNNNKDQLMLNLETDSKTDIPTVYGDICVDLEDRAKYMLGALASTLAGNRNGSIEKAVRSKKHKDEINGRLSSESIARIKGSEQDLYEEGYESFYQAFGADVMKTAFINNGMHPDDADVVINDITRLAYYGDKDDKDKKGFVKSFIGPDNETKLKIFRKVLGNQIDVAPTIELDDTTTDTSEL